MATNKMQDGGPIDGIRKTKEEKKPSLKKILKSVKKTGPGAASSESVSKSSEALKKAKPMSSYKTGGMVNSNAKATVSKVAKGRPTKSAEPKSAAKKATGRVGGISKAPKAAAPKMKMGGSMKKKSC